MSRYFHDQLNVLKLKMFVLKILLVCVRIEVTPFCWLVKSQQFHLKEENQS